MKLALNGASIFFNNKLQKKNILISNKKIISISDIPFKENSNTKCMHLENFWILPAAIDCHVHFRSPYESYKEDWITGSKAALKGGVATVLDMPNNLYPILNLNILKEKRALIKKNTNIHYGLYVTISSQKQSENEVYEILDHPEEYIGIKIYLAQSTGNVLCNNWNMIENLIRKSKRPIAFHVENEEAIQKALLNPIKDSNILNQHDQIRNTKYQIKTLTHLLKLIEQNPAKAKLHFCHISSKTELDLINLIKKKDSRISTEICLHHAYLNNELKIPNAHFFKINPPLKNPQEQEALYKEFINNKIDIVASDHAPHSIKEKMQENYNAIPSGIPSLQMQIPLLLTEVNKKNISINNLVQWTAENPSKIFQIINKGKIDIHYDADLIIINPKEEYYIKNEDLESKAQWNPYANYKLIGRIYGTIVAGSIGYWKGDFFKTTVEEIL